MNTPSSDAKHGFDGFFASVEGQEHLCQKLDDAIRQQQDATPEPPSPDHECLEENDHKWQCDILHDNFEPPEIDNIRVAIWQPDYWKTECQHYANKLDELLFHRKDNQVSAQQWRTIASLYKDLLQLNGLSADETRLLRHSIESQKYWEQEKELLQQRVALREYEMHKAARARKLDIQRRRQERVRRCLQALGDEPPSPPPPEQAARPEGIATRTRLRATCGRELAKHGAQAAKTVSAKATIQRRRTSPHSKEADL